MLNEYEVKKKLRDMAELFRHNASLGEYEKAKNLYNKALTVYVFLGLPEEFGTELFGENGEKGGRIRTGLFNQDTVLRVDKMCCVMANRGYRDTAVLRPGQEPEYYSDEMYCAMCNKKRAPTYAV